MNNQRTKEFLHPYSLARFCGVHQTTIKGMLSNPKDLKPQTKAKIKEGFAMFKATVLAELAEYERKINSL